MSPHVYDASKDTRPASGEGVVEVLFIERRLPCAGVRVWSPSVGLSRWIISAHIGVTLGEFEATGTSHEG